MDFELNHERLNDRFLWTNMSLLVASCGLACTTGFTYVTLAWVLIFLLQCLSVTSSIKLLKIKTVSNMFFITADSLIRLSLYVLKRNVPEKLLAQFLFDRSRLLFFAPIFTSLVMMLILIAVCVRLRDKTVTYKYTSRQRISYLFEYASCLIPLIGASFFGITFWSLPLQMTSLLLLALKTARANQLYCFGRLIHYIVNVCVMLFCAIHSCVTLKENFILVLSTLTLVFASTITVFWDGSVILSIATAKPVYLEYIVSQPISKILVRLATYDFIAKGMLVFAWAIFAPSIGAALPLLIVMYSMGFCCRRSWKWTCLACVIGLGADVITECIIKRKSPNDYIIRASITVSTYFVSEISGFLDHSQLPIQKNILFGSTRNLDILLYVEIGLVFAFSLMKVELINCLLMAIMLWFVISPLAARKFQSLLIVCLMSTICNRFTFTSIAHTFPSARLSQRFIEFAGLHAFFSKTDAKLLILLVVSAIYRHYLKRSKFIEIEAGPLHDTQIEKNPGILGPSHESQIEERPSSLMKLRQQLRSSLHNLCLPLLVSSILVAALSSENFGLITVGYLLLFFWFSIRGMIKNYEERSVFLKFSTFYSAFTIFVCYSFQFIPLNRLIHRVMQNSILTDLGLSTTHNLYFVLSGYFAVLVFSRTQYYFEYECDDQIEGFESNDISWYMEFIKRFLLLHSSRIISISLVFSIVNDCSIFSVFNLLIALKLLFCETLGRNSSLCLTIWLAADVMTKFVFHFEIFNRQMPFALQVLGFRRTQYSYVFDTVLWQLIPLVFLAFQPALSVCQKQLLEKFESIQDIPLLDESHIPQENKQNVHSRRVLSSFIYYISFAFREFGRELTCAFLYAMSVYNNNIFGCLYATIALTCVSFTPRISQPVIICAFIVSSITLFYQYGMYYLLDYNIVLWNGLPKQISGFLGLTLSKDKITVILSFIACLLTAKYCRLDPYNDSKSRFSAEPSDANSMNVAIKKKLIFINIWLAYILAFASAVSEASIPSLILVFLSLYFFRIGSNIYLQKHRQQLIAGTIRYMILWEGLSIILRVPATLLSFPGMEELKNQLLALAGLANDQDYIWSLENTAQVLAIFMLVLHDRILKSPISITITKQLLDENRLATRRSDRFHLHRVEELKQQLEVDSAAASETKRRIKERSGLFATMDIGDWFRVFHGGKFHRKSEEEDIAILSPQPHTLTIARRRVESIIEREEENGLIDLKQESLETGPEELFSPNPEKHEDIDEKDYPYTASGEIRFYTLSIYFWILRSVLKYSEEYRHICELKETYQLIERAKSEGTFSSRMSILVLGLYYAFLSHSTVFVSLCCLFNSIFYANVLSIIPTFLILTFGVCQRPYTRKTFWKHLIRYTTIWIFVLFVTQTKLFHITVPKDVFQFKWSNFFGVSGFETKLQAFVGPFLLLLALMFNRAMMRFMGMWHVKQTSSVEERKLRKETKRDSPKQTQFKFIDLMRGFVDDFGGFLKSIGELPGKDYYLEMFLCDTISLIITCISWNIFSAEKMEEDMYFLKSVISNNTVPLGFVVLTIFQSLLIIFDRIIYCRKALKLKILMQLGTLGIYHAWVVFLVPIVAKKQFRLVFSLCAWYIFKFGYWYYSALQIKQGYPLFRTTNFLFKQSSLINYYTYLCIKSLPLFMEFRNIIDWTFTPSSLSIYMWFKFEQLYAMLYGIRSNRLYTDYRMGRRNLGHKKTQWWKHIIGCLMILGLLLLVFGPFIWLSLPGAMRKNPARRMKLTVGVDNFTIIDSLIFTEAAPLVEKQKCENLKVKGLWPLDFNRGDCQITSISNITSKNLADVERLLAYLNGKTDIKVWIKSKFTRGFTQAAVSVSDIFEVKVSANSLIELILAQVPMIELDDLVPNAFDLKSQGVVSSLHVGMSSKFEIKYEVESNAFSIQQNNGKPYEIIIHSNKISANRLSNYGIIGLYATFVYAVARTLKNSLSNLPFRIPFEDLPSVDILYAICEDLVRVREFGDYYSEEYLYWQLIEIYRRPEQLLYLTKRQ